MGMVPVLACLGGSDILIILAVMAAGALLMQGIVYIPYRWAMNSLARGSLFGKPMALFVTSVGGIVFSTVAMWTLITLVFSGNPAQTFSGIVALGGMFGLFVLSIGWVRTREPMTTSQYPFQVWFQDIIVAVICYAAGLTIISAIGDFNPKRADEFLPWAIYLFIAGTLGLFTAIDVARRSELSQRPLPRAGLFVAIFTVYPVTLPLALVAWWRWRRSLRKSLAAQA